MKLQPGEVKIILTMPRDYTVSDGELERIAEHAGQKAKEWLANPDKVVLLLPPGFTAQVLIGTGGEASVDVADMKAGVVRFREFT